MFIKLYHLLTHNERKKAVSLFVFMFVGMLLETLGVGLIVPVMTIMMQDNFVNPNSLFAPFLKFFEYSSKIELITLIMLFLLVAYFIKNTFLAFLVWKQKQFSFNVRINMSERMFNNYLRQPYTFHLSRNSAELIRNSTTGVDHFSMLISNLLTFLTEILVVVGISIMLLIIEPLGTVLVVGIFALFAWLYHQITSKHISNWGYERQLHNGLRLKHLLQGLGSVKDVKLLGRESDFIKQFQMSNTRTFTVMKHQAVIAEFPRLLFEFLAVTGLVIIVISMLFQQHEIQHIIPTLGLFAAAAFRLMPSINKILLSVQQFKYTSPVVDALYDELCIASDVEEDCQDRLTFNDTLILKNIAYHYQNTNKLVLENISLKIERGQSIGIIGPSGSGKSTLIDLMIGLLIPSSGSFHLDGKKVLLSNRKWKDKIGYVSQSIYLTDDTLRRNIAFGLADEEIDDSAVLHAIQAAQLDSFVNQLPDGSETVIGENGIKLSGGQKQRIGIARALYHNPELLVLDEATSALDQETESEVMDAVIKLHGQKTLIIIAHRLSTVKDCDRLYRLDKGKIVEFGTPEEILKKKSF